jgi:hypothetical protein
MLSMVMPELSILIWSLTGSSVIVTSLTSRFTINRVLPLSAIVDSDVVYGGVSIVVTVIGVR